MPLRVPRSAQGCNRQRRAVPEHEAVEWAMQTGVLCTDEELLDPHPFRTRQEWCWARLRETESRLGEVPELPSVLINHFPMREELVTLPFIPRFSIWCGTRRTHDWHIRYRASVVVSGHLHIPRTAWIDGVRFEEVSFGYPRNRRTDRPIEHYIREILPGPRVARV